LRKHLVNDQGSISRKSSRQLKKPILKSLFTAMMLNLLTAILLVAPSAVQAATIDPSTGTRAKPLPENSSQILAFKASDIANGRYSSLLNVQTTLVDNLFLMPQWFAASGSSEIGMRLNNQTPNRPPEWSGDWANFGMFTAQPSQLKAPFNNVQVNWNATTPEGTAVELDVRASKDGQNWTLWNVQTANHSLAQFEEGAAYLYVQYRARLFSKSTFVSPTFKGVELAANVRDLSNLPVANIMSAAPQTAPTFQVFATREGLVGGRTANGHIIQSHDHFVSLPSWTALNDFGKYDYQVRIVTPNGTSATAPVWDTGPWNFHDDYWHNPRHEFKDLPVGTPESERAIHGYNNGLNENGSPVYMASGIDIGDGTFWDDLNLGGASTDGRLSVTFLWEGINPVVPPTLSNAQSNNASRNAVTLTWQTTTSTNSWVEYGFSTNYDQFSPVDNSMVTSHSLTVYDLTPSHTYHYRVHSKDVYGNEVVSSDATFTTTDGQTATLKPWQHDKGIGVNIAKNWATIKVAGGRANNSYWNDNPKDDFNAGATTNNGAIAANGALDLDLLPACDDKGQNCTFGFGSGYKSYVQFNNYKGDIVRIGIIHGAVISPNSATLMVEGTVNGVQVGQYYPADSVDVTKPHHLHIAWFNKQLWATFDYAAHINAIAIAGDGLQVSFAGAGRAKDDIVATTFDNIAFGDGTVLDTSK
jgi:hypothetical protein